MNTRDFRKRIPVFSRTESIIVSVIIVVVIVTFIHTSALNTLSKRFSVLSSRQEALISSPAASSPLAYSRTRERTVEETASSRISPDPYVWINSGGLFYYEQDGTARTVQGELPRYSFWRMLYALTNPTDTDNGYHPQNIFRLVTRQSWQNATQEAYFNITKDNLSKSPNRNASNGIFLFNRYMDSDNLYYAGLRVDGALVLKKKYRGTYYTMKYKPYIPGKRYDRNTNPSLLPKKTWIGLKTQTKNTDNGVLIEMFVDRNGTGTWKKELEVLDRGQFGKTPPLSKAGFAGIRSDFVDLNIKGFTITDL